MWEVVLRRSNGRFVKVLDKAKSKYAGKSLAKFWEDKYDSSYQVTVEKPTTSW